MHRLPAYCLTVLLLGFPAAAPAALADPLASPAASLTELRQQLDAFIKHPRFSGATWGVKVASLATGRTVYEHDPTRLLTPASNTKLFVAALALDQLGGDFRIVTPLLATNSANASGVLAGDLVVSGRGDPSWKAQPRTGDFWLTFDRFITVLRAAGVRHVTGDLVADTTFLRMPRHGAGWVIDDLAEYYGAEISALTLEENYADLRVQPAETPGEPAVFELLQPHTGLQIRNHTVTVAAGATRTLHRRRELAGPVVHLFGELPLGSEPELLAVTVPQPAAWFARALREALARAGIEIAGTVRTVGWPEPPPAAATVQLGEVASPPLRELIRRLMKPSQNLETDLLFALLGEQARTAATPAWRTSEQCAVNALQAFLRDHLLPADEVKFEEGSGLSRNNLTTANATVALLTFMHHHRAAAAFRDSLPIAGVDGTIRRRMKATAAEGNVRAKTGTLRWANSLSGYVTSAAGEPLVFSVMLNRHAAPAGRSGRDEIDAIAVALAGFTGETAIGSASPPSQAKTN